MLRPKESTNALWTFVVDCAGGTYIRQYVASDVLQAIKLYNAEDFSKYDIGPLDSESGEKPVRVNEVSNVWCVSGTNAADELVLANIVKTEWLPHGKEI